VNNQHLLNTKGPKIIIANHPNTLMDAWMIGYMCKQPIYYMAKATFFNSPLKKKLLMSLGMVPINRSSDGNTKGVSNTDSFEQCYQLLEEGKTLVIFPEGTSYSERLLRKLKSGSARIAMQTELRNDGKLGLEVIPVGLVYLQPEKFRSDVVANVGEPISPVPYLGEFRADSLKAARKLTEEFRVGLSSQLVGSESKESETLSEQIITILSSSYDKEQGKGVNDNVSFIKKVNQKVNLIAKNDSDTYDKINQLVYQVNWRIEQLDLKSSFLDRNFRSNMFLGQIIFSILGLVMALPVFLWGIVHSAIPYYFTDWVIPKIVREVEYYAPLAVLLGLVLYPLNYLGFVWLTDLLFDLSVIQKWIYFWSLPASGLFAYYFYHYYKHITFKLSFMILMKTEKEAIESLKEDREELRKIVLS
jgi:1-acyl-sn-glycerol-3-phosphate acyltransferase